MLMSDRYPGLISAVSDKLPNIVKCNCLRHIAKNLKQGFKNSTLIDKYRELLCTYNVNEFKKMRLNKSN